MAIQIQKGTEHQNHKRLTSISYSRSGCGKALANSELVLTPNGFIKNEELKVGDYVVGSNGEPTKVIGVYPQGLREIFTVTFSDGTTVNCTEDHLWTVYMRGQLKDSKPYVLPLKLIMDENFKPLLTKRKSKNKKDKKAYLSTETTYHIPMCYGKGYNFSNKKDLLLDPMLLGMLIGDGGFTNSSIKFTNGKFKNILLLRDLLPKNDKLTSSYLIDKNGKNDDINNFKKVKGAYHVRIVSANNAIKKGSQTKMFLEEYNLVGKHSIEKFIPEDYLYSDINNREKLYKGLMLTDGSSKHDFDKKRFMQYYTSSKQLKDDVVFLIRSLGYYASVSTGKAPKYKYKGKMRISENYKYTITLNNANNGCKPLKRKGIVSVEFSHIEDATCIRVDAEDSLYVAGYGFNLTHNTTFNLTNLKRAVLIDYEDGIGDAEISDDLTIIKCNDASDFREAIEYIEQNKSNFDTVVLDSITKYGDKLYAAVSEIYPDKKDGLNLWGMIDTVSRQRFEQLMSLDLNILIIALEEQVVLESGFRGAFVSYKGKKFKSSLEAQVDVIIHFEKDQEGNFIRDWKGDNVAVGKNRFPKTLGDDAMKYNNMQEVIDKLNTKE